MNKWCKMNDIRCLRLPAICYWVVAWWTSRWSLGAWPSCCGAQIESKMLPWLQTRGILVWKRLGASGFTNQTIRFCLVMLWIDAGGVALQLKNKWVRYWIFCLWPEVDVFSKSVVPICTWDFKNMFISSQFNVSGKTSGWALRRILWSNVLHDWENKMSSCWRRGDWWWHVPGIQETRHRRTGARACKETLAWLAELEIKKVAGRRERDINLGW